MVRVLSRCGYMLGQTRSCAVLADVDVVRHGWCVGLPLGHAVRDALRKLGDQAINQVE
ncbi:hypothetical protein [Nocardia brasiliensis]|uniref:hypothetical protein n=1 Tax=Nocardia brasiliensis TaxID=37326 RepID=UPI00130DFE55|nr:hypothetical protein [Nocardia brasiliensis]